MLLWGETRDDHDVTVVQHFQRFRIGAALNVPASIVINLPNLELASRDDGVVQHSIEHRAAGEPKLIVLTFNFAVLREKVIEVLASDDVCRLQYIRANDVDDTVLVGRR